MDHISTVLRAVLGSPEIREKMANHALFSRWPEVVGDHLATATKPVRVQGRTLWVWVESAALQHELTFLVPRLIGNLRASAPGSTIDSIRFTLNPEAPQ